MCALEKIGVLGTGVTGSEIALVFELDEDPTLHADKLALPHPIGPVALTDNTADSISLNLHQSPSGLFLPQPRRRRPAAGGCCGREGERRWRCYVRTGMRL